MLCTANKGVGPNKFNTFLFIVQNYNCLQTGIQLVTYVYKLISAMAAKGQYQARCSYFTYTWMCTSKIQKISFRVN